MEKKRCKTCGKNKFVAFFEGDKESCILCEKEKNESLKPHKLKVSKEEYNLIFKIQGGKCAVCKKPAENFKRKLCPDYDSKTKQLRGLLCVGCNSALSQLKEKQELVIRLIDYVNNNPGKEMQNQIMTRINSSIKVLYMEDQEA